MIKTIQGNSVSPHLRYVRFIRLFLTGAIALVAPFLSQLFLGQSAILVRAALILIIGLYCAHIILSNRVVDFRRRPRYAIAIILFLGTRPVVELIHGEFGLTSLMSFVATALIIWALWSLNPMLEWFRFVAIFGFATAVLALAMSAVTPQMAFMVTELGNLQGGYKTSAGRGLLAGPFGNANTLGIVLATSIPFVFLWPKTTTRCLILAPILIALWMSVARTSLIATGIVLFVGILMFRSQSTLGFRKVVSAFIIGGAAAVQASLPLLISDPSFFTGRGNVWLIDLAAWARHPWFGNGEAWHTGQRAVRDGIMLIDHTNSHNTALGWLVIGGLFYFVSCAALMILLVRASWAHLDRNSVAPIFFVVVLLVVGISESHWHVFSVSPLFFVHGFLLAGIIFSQPSEHRQISAPQRFSSASSESLLIDWRSGTS